MLKKKIITWIIGIVCIRGAVVAQALSFDHINTNNGLSQNSVLSITQDYRGFMWFATGHGVNRYDGVSFKKYLLDPNDSTSISNDFINCILADSRKNIWIGTTRGLNKLNLETDKVERISYEGGDKGLSDHFIRCLYEDREGNIWVGTSNGLNIISLKQGLSIKKMYADNTKGIAGNTILTLFEDSENSIWVGTTNGLSRVFSRNNNYEFETFKHNENDKGSIPSDIVYAISEDDEHNMWVSTQVSGLVSFNRVANRFTAVATDPLIRNDIRTIKKATDGKLWIGTVAGLLVKDLANGTDHLYYNDPLQPRSLSENSVFSVFLDAAGSAWIGTYFGGLNVTHPNSNTFTTWRKNKTGNSISHDLVLSIAEDDAKNLWVCTEGEGLNYIDRKTGKISLFLHDAKKPGSIGTNSTRTVYKDSDGDIWIGTNGGGLYLLNPATKTFTNFIFDPSNPATARTEIITLLEDTQKRFWVGTLNGVRLFRKQDRRLVEDTSALISGRVGTAYISSVIEDYVGNVWIGTFSGLYMLKKGESEIKKVDEFVMLVKCLYDDKQGNIWSNDPFSGLLKYTPATKKLVHFTISKDIPGNQVYGITGDDKGNLWIVTDIQLCRFNPKDSSIVKFDSDKGAFAGGIIKNAVYKSESGELFFGGQNGLIAFYPDSIHIGKNESPLLFTSLKLNNDEVEVKVDNKLLSKDISLTDKLTLDNNQSTFTLSFALLNYIETAKNRYAYKLVGVDNDWNYSAINFVKYTALPAGNYQLLVKAANNDGTWREPITLKIDVLPTLWKSWWAYCIYFLGFIIVQVLIIRYCIQLGKKREHA